MLQNLISSGYYKTGSATWGAFQRWKIHNKQFFTNLEGTGKVHTQRCNIMHYKSAHYHHILWWTVGIIQCRFVQNLYTLDAVHEDGWDLLEILKSWVHWRLAAPPWWKPHVAILCSFESLPLPNISVLVSSDFVSNSHTYPGLQKYFRNGLHVILRSDSFWTSLSLDLVIEQVLLRSLKTSEGSGFPPGIIS